MDDSLPSTFIYIKIRLVRYPDRGNWIKKHCDEIKNKSTWQNSTENASERIAKRMKTTEKLSKQKAIAVAKEKNMSRFVHKAKQLRSRRDFVSFARQMNQA